MTLLDLLCAPWALEPDMLREMQAIYATHLRGEKIDIAAIEARLGRPLANDQQDYVVREGGIAVLGAEGVISPKANLFTRVSGGTSAQILTTQIESAMVDARVRGMVLAIDSPGGSVFGTPELATAIHRMAAEKPIVSVSEAKMASAAYWFGAAANAAFITGPTVQVGSIGVVATHDYAPRAGAGQGARTTEITAGRYKRVASTNDPLTEEGRAYLQDQVDHIYSVFVDAVAQYRGTDAETVLEHMADGRVFIGQQAVDAGLVDGVATVDAIVEQMASNPQQFATRRKARVASRSAPKSKSAGAARQDAPHRGNPAAISPTVEEIAMSEQQAALTRESLERDHAALFAQVRSEFVSLGASQERDRITSVRAQSLPGHEQLVEQLAMDGRTTGPEAAAAVLQAERSARAAAAQAHADDAPAPVKTSVATEDPKAKTKDQQVSEAKTYAASHGVDFVAAMKTLGFAA